MKRHEFGGATGRPREVSLCIDNEVIAEPSIIVDSTGDGMFSEICLRVVRKISILRRKISYEAD